MHHLLFLNFLYCNTLKIPVGYYGNSNNNNNNKYYDLLPLSQAPYFENALTLGLYLNPRALPYTKCLVAAAADNVEGSLHLHYHKLQRCIVMTFLVRECYGSPKKHEFYRSTGEHSVNICVEECFDKVLHHVNLRISKCKMTNVITMQRCL